MTQLNYRNLCRCCDKDFASVTAFDRHRTGDHELDYPEWEDGRRCRDEQEMIEARMERDGSGRWRITLTEADLERLRLSRGPWSSPPKPKHAQPPLSRV